MGPATLQKKLSIVLPLAEFLVKVVYYEIIIYIKTRMRVWNKDSLFSIITVDQNVKVIFKCQLLFVGRAI